MNINYKIFVSINTYRMGWIYYVGNARVESPSVSKNAMIERDGIVATERARGLMAVDDGDNINDDNNDDANNISRGTVYEAVINLSQLMENYATHLI